MRLLTFLALMLAFPLAIADDHCRNMNGHGRTVDIQEPCEFDGVVYDFCFVNEVRGTINGTVFEYFQWDWIVWLEGLGVPTPPDAGGSFYNREFAVLTSKQGTVWGEAQYVYDLRVLDTGGVAVPTLVTGGTGIYEDAYGWITFTFGDETLLPFSIDGRVCGPNISTD